MLSLLPAVLLIAGAFFYVLPRRVEASRAVGSGNAMVGFDDRIRLDQLGRLSQNSMIALKVELTNARTGKPYRARGSLYLRGKTLETYEVDFQDSRPTATWVAQPPEAMNKSSLLPDRARISDSEFAARLDDVNVRITCETMNRPSLFSIAPYHRIGVEDSNEDALMHVVNRWTLQRRDKEPPHPRIEYSFGTAAFADKKQTPLIGDPPFKRLSDTSSILDLTPQLREQQLQNRRYLRAVLQCDRKRIPTIVRKAEEITDSIPDANRTRASVALAMERYLANDADFQYTLNLNSTPIPNLDPIEQFMAVDRRGHCQYFASSLALMLRSVGIPSRVVVGYRTEEYNPIGKYHIARQSHAHAWVEALIEAGELPPAIVPAGQSLAKRYWMRLDPTPSASAEDDGNAAGVSGLINLANHLWDDYVVEMDQKKQTEGLGRATQLDAVQDSYEGFFTRLKNRMKSTFGTETSAGSFRLDRDAIVLFVLLFMAMLLTMWFGSRLVGISFGPEANAGTETIAAAIPQLDFYRTMLEQLERLGIERQYHETPYEFLSRIDADLPAIDSLTRTFVQHRYGASESDETDVRSQSELSLLTMEVERRLRQRTFSS
ncbi:MAG: transglutaminaseTgpA domain-containing protein [Planctomycetota bacterium]